ncbi:BlaI/MecI/CopY family transcriptional regulator [Microvenator marinus]|uniref:BlaI/MecI/CopY family transcriptional regulator n=1 Tax=Microvenator marinus TaxID=2600177 RepID=A0A5B8XQT4_9DELT|nr:BlaI/MecI/CopY family transcriptional regulator [Microvenator marinus]QED25769.1 BlaI/MecI/CopY family transcriptional regulator [Microvenator marinus]
MAILEQCDGGPMLRVPELALGDLERDVLDALWKNGELSPVSVHQLVGEPRNVSVNTVASALKRLHQKGLLHREKVSHSYVYSPAISRADLQKLLIGEIANQFDDQYSSSFFAAFLDLAEEQGEDSLRMLEEMIAQRLEGGEE